MAGCEELRAQLDQETAEALRLADDLVAELTSARLDPKAAELVAAYLRVRAWARRLRRILVVEVAG